MNEMILDTRTPIEIALEIDTEGRTTARQLYEFLELAQGQFSRWAKTNIENNEFYEENVDWWGFDTMSNGNVCKDYRLTTEFAKHLSMESHSARGKEARKYFVSIEERVKEKAVQHSNLSPQLKLFQQMFEAVAAQEQAAREAKELAQKAGVGRSAVIKMRKGQPVWRTTAGHVANALGVPLEELKEVN